MNDKYDTYDEVLAILDQTANLLGLERQDYLSLKYPEREMKVSMSVEMDDGSFQVFEGYRVQHSSVLGPYKRNRCRRNRCRGIKLLSYFCQHQRT